MIAGHRGLLGTLIPLVAVCSEGGLPGHAGVLFLILWGEPLCGFPWGCAI